MRAAWKFWNALREETGQVLVLAALVMSALLGFVAMSTDVGILFRAKRDSQTAADAAAVAGALDYLYNGNSASAIAAGKAAATANGVTDGTNGATVTINIPAANGPNAGVAGFLEAIVKVQQKTVFMGMFGRSKMAVTARAVAGTPTNGQACIWIMANSGPAFNMQGSYDIEATGCGIYVNSPSSNAFSVTGNGGTVNAKFLDVVGNSPPAHQTKPTPTTVNAAPRKNPWGNLAGPNPSTGSGCGSVDSTTTTLTGTMAGPGAGNTICYTKLVTLNNLTVGTGSLGTTIATTTVTSSAGTLVFGSGVKITGTVTVYGGTIDVYGGSYSQNSNSIFSIIAPKSGTYNGVALMQPSNNTNAMQIQWGSNNQVFDGYIYAPGAQLTLQDNGGGVNASGIVALSMNLGPSKITIPSYDAAHPTTTVNRIVTLVE
jgi:Flp pilus assembly protein TadG